MTITILSGWRVQNQAEIEADNELGRQMLTPPDGQLTPIEERSLNNTVDLLSLVLKDSTTDEPYGPTFLIAAEPIPVNATMRGRDFLMAMQAYLKQKQATLPVKFEFSKEIYSELINGANFDVLHLQMSSEGIGAHQRIYVRIIKGWVVFVMLSYVTPEELRQMNEVLRTMRVRPEAAPGT